MARKIKVLIPRVGGTNCDLETAIAFEDLGAQARVVHFKKILNKQVNLSDYDALVLPGGFSFSDFIRAGAAWGKMIAYSVKREFSEFIEGGKPVLGICNGFQILVEAGILPDVEGGVEAALGVNDSMRYECRWVYVRHVNRGGCKLTKYLPRDAVLRIPVAHNEGKFMLSPDRETEYLKLMEKRDQIVFRYSKPDGSFANKEYPFNPNGSVMDVAGVCNRMGNVLGMMPHPERAFFGWQLPDWTRLGEPPKYGDGKLILESMLKYVEEEVA